MKRHDSSDPVNDVQKLLILDLDETLIFGSTQPLNRTADFTVAGRYHIYKRPYLETFLDYCFASFSVAVWTFSTRD